MGRLIVWFLALAAVAGVAAWLAEQQGTVVFAWSGWRAETSVGVVVLAVVLLLAAALLAYRFLVWLIHAPAAMRERRIESRRRRGYEALTRGLVAVAAGDAADAKKLAKRTTALLDEPPLTLLLAAQAAQLDGDEALARRHFEALAAHPESEFLGVRGLLVLAKRRGDDREALVLANRAARLRPDSPWVLNELFALQARSANWQAAERTLTDAVKRRVIGGGDARRRRAVVLYEQAQAANDNGEAKRALDLARKAHEAVPDFVPATVLEARLLAVSGQGRKARKILEESWSRSPHPELAAAYLDLDPAAGPDQRLKQMERLASFQPEHEESRLAVAQAAIAAQEWETAQAQLSALAPDAPDRLPGARACRLFAELAEKAGGDSETARQWLKRAAGAPADVAWQCETCGRRSPAWMAHCPECGSFDSFRWRRPAGDTPAILELPPRTAEAASEEPQPVEEELGSPERLLTADGRPDGVAAPTAR